MSTYIICEAGTGHYAPLLGDRIRRVQDFILSAKVAGADAVKFQMFVPDEPLFCPLPGDDRRMVRWADTCLSLDEWKHYKVWAKKLGVDLLWSAFQPTCVEWLKELKPRYVKVASRARETFPYWSDKTHFIVSGTTPEAPAAFYKTKGAWASMLKCVPQYPAPLKECGYEVGDHVGGDCESPCYFEDDPFDGLSDHSGTIWPGLDAIYHQAKFLEVHVKLPGCDMGNDEPVCLTMEQLKLLCDARDAYKVMHAAA